MVYRGISLALIGLILLALGLIAVGCYTNPATGEEQLSFYSTEQEIQMGREADKQITASMGVYPDSSLQRYIDSLGQKLAAVSERPDLPWSFKVIDDPTVNAFALPGGFIYVTRGILGHFNNEAQLSGVLGHEIGHVTARHSVNQMSKQQLFQLGVGLGTMIEPDLQEYTGLIGAGMQLLFLKFSRDDERQADDLGLRYMVRARKDPREMDDIFEMLGRVSEQAGSGRVPVWMSTHPSPENRVERIRQAYDTLSLDYATTGVGRDVYLQYLDDVVYGNDPREGYFEGSTFYHPTLTFRFQFPDGWQTMNQKQGVLAASPEQDAVIQITLSQAATPRAAADQFFTQQGMSGGAVQSTTINNLTAVSGEFQAQAQQGTLAGMAVFVELDNTVFQILGYSTSSGWPSYQATVRQSARSFARLTDQSKLSVSPMRIDIVTVPEAMTLSQYHERYPSEVDLETLAIINQLEADSRLTAGQKLKRIVK
ncbi:M48 family metalloprotease [candidate division GN15 bacterium]|nr:M48 family metalloprotease [candidate division GN15 bacterium]